MPTNSNREEFNPLTGQPNIGLNRICFFIPFVIIGSLLAILGNNDLSVRGVVVAWVVLAYCSLMTLIVCRSRALQSAAKSMLWGCTGVLVAISLYVGFFVWMFGG